MKKLGMVIDLERCIGCNTCAIGCKMQNNVPEGMLWNRILTEGGGEEYDTPGGVYPHVQQYFRPVACQHCENAGCVKVCPVQATYKDENGRVLINYDRCIGCRYCMAACPYNVRVFNWKKAVRQPDFNYGDKEVPVRKVGIVEKCTLCKERTDKDMEPMCVVVCPARARTYGDLNDPESKVARMVQEKNAEQLLEHAGMKPQVYYLPAKGRVISNE